MSTRRELIEILRRLPDGDPDLRVSSICAYLDALPAEEAALAERRVLALTRSYERADADFGDMTLEAFFEVVDQLGKDLVN